MILPKHIRKKSKQRKSAQKFRVWILNYEVPQEYIVLTILYKDKSCMGLDIKALIAKLKTSLKETALASVILFGLGKVLFSFMELPHDEKSSTYIPFLLLTLLFYTGSIGFKILHHRLKLLRKLIKIELQCFLLWVLTAIFIIFSWGLTDALSWNAFEKILLVLCLIFTTFIVTLLTDPEFISRLEFLAFEFIFGLEILAVSIKTVGYIRYDSESPHKDIVLLTLTTQIALMIVFMDVVEKSASKWKQKNTDEDMARLEKQMVFNSHRRPSVDIRESLDEK